jgi:hypothetical protein
MPDIAAGPGYLTRVVQTSACSPCTLAARTGGAPLSRRATDPCCPTRSPSPLRAPATTRGRCLSPTSATDHQHEHPQNRWIPSLQTPCGALCAGGSAVDAVLPASAVLSTLSSKGEERLTERRCAAGGFVQPPAALESSTSDAPCRQPIRPARGGPSQPARNAFTPPPSRGTASTLRSIFRRQVLPHVLLAQVVKEPATVLAALPPANRLPAFPLRPPTRRPSGRRFRSPHPSIPQNGCTVRATEFPRSQDRLGTPPVNLCNHHGS